MLLLGLEENMASRLQKLVEFAGEETRSRVDVYDGAANILCQRRTKALENMVWIKI